MERELDQVRQRSKKKGLGVCVHGSGSLLKGACLHVVFVTLETLETSCCQILDKGRIEIPALPSLCNVTQLCTPPVKGKNLLGEFALVSCWVL